MHKAPASEPRGWTPARRTAAARSVPAVSLHARRTAGLAGVRRPSAERRLIRRKSLTRRWRASLRCTRSRSPERGALKGGPTMSMQRFTRSAALGIATLIGVATSGGSPALADGNLQNVNHIIVVMHGEPFVRQLLRRACVRSRHTVSQRQGRGISAACAPPTHLRRRVVLSRVKNGASSAGTRTRATSKGRSGPSTTRASARARTSTTAGSART